MSEEEKVPRTVERQVAYGKRMYAGGQEVGAREEREAVLTAIDQALALTGEKEARFNYLGWRSALADLQRIITAGEHRKEADRG